MASPQRLGSLHGPGLHDLAEPKPAVRWSQAATSAQS